MIMYELLLTLHSYVRWWAVGGALVTLLYAAWAAAGRRAWSRRDERLARIFVAGVDVQVLLGLTLYLGLSPLPRAARAVWSARGFAALWQWPGLGFFGLVHPLAMLLAAVAAHAGWVAARRGPPHARRRRVVIGAALALALFAAGVPWPLLGHDRPWLRALI